MKFHNDERVLSDFSYTVVLFDWRVFLDRRSNFLNIFFSSLEITDFFASSGAIWSSVNSSRYPTFTLGDTDSIKKEMTWRNSQ